MFKKLIPILLLLLSARPLLAADITTTVCPGAGCIDYNVSSQGSIGLQITGTWSGTITFKSSIDGTTFVSLGVVSVADTTAAKVLTTTANGTYQATVAGLRTVRVVFTSHSSGTASVYARMTTVAGKFNSSGSGGGGSGTVTSVDLTAPSIITITGNPITTSGTIDLALATQTTNKVFAAPSGSTGTPTFRALVTADMPSGTGTVTSTSFTGGLISVASPTSTPALTVAGTSGGIPYFSSSSTWASSGVLGSGGLVFGGGAGTAPATSTNLTWVTAGLTNLQQTLLGNQSSGDFAGPKSGYFSGSTSEFAVGIESTHTTTGLNGYIGGLSITDHWNLATNASGGKANPFVLTFDVLATSGTFPPNANVLEIDAFNHKVTGTMPALTGIYVNMDNSAAATITDMTGIWAAVGANTTGATITTLYALLGQTTSFAGTTVGTMADLRLDLPVTLGTVTNLDLISAADVSGLTTGGRKNFIRYGADKFVVDSTGAITAPKLNGLTVTTSTGTLTIPNSASLITAGAFATTITSTATTNSTLPAGTHSLASLDSPSFTTPSLGVATATSINGNTFTTGTYTLTGVAGKTLTFNKSLTLDGTDSTTMTFPTTSATIARTDAANTFTGTQTFAPGVGVNGIVMTGATQTTDQPMLNLAQTWNAAGVTFTGIKSVITNTASASGSLALDLQVGAGSSVFSVRKDGYTAIASHLVAVGAVIAGTGQYLASGGANTLLYADNTNQFDQRNGSSAQKFSIYNTFTSTVNFERLMFDWATSANVAMIYTQKGGSGGTARVLQLNYGGTTTSAISIPITSGDITLGGNIFPTGYKSSDGTAGATVTTCTGFKNGLCVSGS